MPKPIQEMTSWGATGVAPLDTRAYGSSLSANSAPMGRSVLPAGEEWAASPSDIGRRVGDTMWDMSVVCEPAEALSLQFDVLQPLYLAVHDIGGTTSRRLLAGVAAAMQIPVHTLTIRRQGYGNLLARLEFVELMSSDPSLRTAQRVRIYSTQTPETEEPARRQMVEVLLGRAALSVIIIDGEVSQAALAVALAGLQNALKKPAWTNRHVLLMPLRTMRGLEAQAAQLGREQEIDVQATPAIVRPFDAWNHVRSRWNALADLGESTMMPLEDPTSPLDRKNRHSPEQTAAAVEALRRKLLAQRDHQAAEVSAADAHVDAAAKTIVSMSKRESQRSAPGSLAPVAPEPSHRPVPPAGDVPVLAAQDDAPTVPAHLLPVPAAAAVNAAAPSPEDRIDRFVSECAGVAGLRGCAVIHLETRGVVAAHTIDDPKGFAGHGARLVNSLRAAALGFGIPGRVPDASMTFDEHHLLVRPVPGHEHMAFVAILGREDANVVVVRLKLQRIERAVFPDTDATESA